MKIDIISVQPKMFAGFLTESIVARAVKKGACEIAITDLREFGEGRWKKVDDKPYGGGPGMLMKCGPWFAAVESCLGREVERKGGREEGRQDGREVGRKNGKEVERKDGDEKILSSTLPSYHSTSLPSCHPTFLSPRIIMTTPTGKKFTQRDAEMFANLEEKVRVEGQGQERMTNSATHHSPEAHLIFLCGHYEGFDARIETLVTDKYSVGDFVMTGGELAAAAMVDAIVRLLPGVLGGGPAATSNESFSLRDPSCFGREVERKNGSEGTLSSTLPSYLPTSTFLEAPQYTHPPEFRGMKVPEVLLSGDHAKIESWRAAESRKLTAAVRPDLLNTSKETK